MFWPVNDVTTDEEAQLDSPTIVCGLKQQPKEPTHILENCFTWRDLLFTSQPNFIIDNGTHPTIHWKCHHQLIYVTLHFKIEYTPSYTGEVWNYNRADSSSHYVRFWSTKLFLNKSECKQVILFNKRFWNILLNIIQSKIIIYDDKDFPWWMMK